MSGNLLGPALPAEASPGGCIDGLGARLWLVAASMNILMGTALLRNHPSRRRWVRRLALIRITAFWSQRPPLPWPETPEAMIRSDRER